MDENVKHWSDGLRLNLFLTNKTNQTIGLTVSV